MAGEGPLDLFELARDLLNAAVEALDTIPDYDVSLSGAPSRRYVSPGVPARDCPEQLTVHVSQIAEAATDPSGLGAGQRARLEARLNHVTLVLGVTRCIPVGTQAKTTYVPPEESELENAARQINADGWALWNHLWNRVRQGLLFETCKGVFWTGARIISPEGGSAGWTFTFTVTLDGYEEVIAIT